METWHIHPIFVNHLEEEPHKLAMSEFESSFDSNRTNITSQVESSRSDYLARLQPRVELLFIIYSEPDPGFSRTSRNEKK